MPAVLIGKGFQKKSVFYYQGDGYYYHRNRTLKNGSFSLRCVKYYSERCPGRAVASQDLISLRISTEHNCCVNYDFWKVRKLREAILLRCSSRDTTRPKTIVAQEGESYTRAIRRRCSAKLLRSSIRRARMRVFPTRIPKDLSELDAILRSEEFMHLTLTKEGDGYIYAGSCGSARSHTRCLIFQSPQMKKMMANAKEIFADATWDGRPACPASSQVFSISMLLNNQIIPLCVCLMERKSTKTYTTLLQAVKVLNPEFNPSKIHTDFEIAEFSSFQHAFPGAQVEGCLFHYSTNVSIRARKLGLAPYIAADKTFDSVVRSSLAIPLVKPERIREAFGAVVIRSHEENFQNLTVPLFEYIWDEYITKRGDVLSVYGSENRTNNVSESWNHMLQLEMSVRRPNVYHFLGGLRNLEEQAHQDYYNIMRGDDTSRGRKISAIVNDTTIVNLTKLLDRREISMPDFLRRASRTLEKPYRRQCPGPPPPQ